MIGYMGLSSPQRQKLEVIWNSSTLDMHVLGKSTALNPSKPLKNSSLFDIDFTDGVGVETSNITTWVESFLVISVRLNDNLGSGVIPHVSSDSVNGSFSLSC
jgi:hypothetical protein